MPRLSKKAKTEWAFFLHPQTGRRTYNEICRSCTHECKQSFRALLLECPKYESKRAVRYALKKAPMDDKSKEIISPTLRKPLTGRQNPKTRTILMPKSVGFSDERS